MSWTIIRRTGMPVVVIAGIFTPNGGILQQGDMVEHVEVLPGDVQALQDARVANINASLTQAAVDEADIGAVRSDSLVQSFLAMTPAALDTYLTGRWGDLSTIAQRNNAVVDLKRMAKILMATSRQALR